jgi:VCBS repeat-containing protein
LLPDTALLRYVPNTFNGETATISFRAWDASSGVAGGLGSTLSSGGSTSFSTTVEVASIVIVPVNDSPVAVNDNYTVNEDVRLTVSGQGVLQNDTDIDVPAQSLSVSEVNGTALSGNPLAISTTSSGGAAIVVNGNGSFTYDPTTSAELQKLPAGQSRQDTFRYKIRDNSAGPNNDSNEAIVTLTVTGVNDRPVSNDLSISATEDGGSVSAFFNSTDIDTGETASLRYTVVAQPTEGTVTASTSPGDAQFTFAPGTAFQDLGVGQTRQVVFTYRARDAQFVDSNVATVTVTVTGVNDAPVARNVSVTTTEDGPVVGDLFDVTDVDNDTLTFTIEDNPTKGTAVLSGSGGFSFDPGTDFQSLRDGDTEIVTFTYKATEMRVGPPLYKNHSLTNFSPRVGLAWDPEGNGRTAVRASSGIFYDQFDRLYALFFNSPQTISASLDNPAFPRPDYANRNVVRSSNTIEDNIDIPTTIQFIVSIQRELFPGLVLSTAYVGSHGSHLLVTPTNNPALPHILSDGRYFIPVGTRRGNPELWGGRGVSSECGRLPLSFPAAFTEPVAAQRLSLWCQLHRFEKYR